MLQAAYTAVFILLLYALLLITGLRMEDVVTPPIDERQNSAVKGKGKEKEKRRIIDMYALKNQVIANAQVTKLNTSWEGFLRATLAFALGGFALGSIFGNMILAIVFIPCFALIPNLYLSLRSHSYRENLQKQMEQAVEHITNTYIQYKDLNAAFSSIIENTYEPMRGILQTYLNEVSMNESATEALRHMRDKIDDRLWRRWIDRLIQCQKNSSMRFMLTPIPEEMTINRQEQAVLDTQMRALWADHIMTAALSLVTIPFILLLNPAWANVLTDTFIGQLAVALNVVTIIIATLYANKINKPVHAIEE